MHIDRPVLETDGVVVQRFSFGVVRRRVNGPDVDVDQFLSDHEGVLASWSAGIRFHQGQPASDARGFRRPQLGALHAVLAHWSTGSTEPATVVLPTGSGKSDTMIALLIAARLQRLLVIVPSDALRNQLADQFESLGVLARIEVLPGDAQSPSVGRVTGRPGTLAETAAFFEAAQVIISTPHALTAAPTDATRALYEACDAVFFDEAHHVQASTWTRIRNSFSGKKIVQFTATPFREDGQHIQGRFVYVFPLRQAQADRIYGKINYASVYDLSDPDRAIARRATEVLDRDLAQGHDHLLMARCRSRADAERVHALYRSVAPGHNPVILHSAMSRRRQQEALRAVWTRQSRVIVCVDMLGEGFDLPQLKIAALHDPKRSLAPTLQFTGRFARVAAGTGDATVVASRTDRMYDRRLARLYGEDADWNLLIAEIADAATLKQESVSRFEQDFNDAEARVATRAVSPKMSTVVYRTTCEEWSPEAALEVFDPEDIITNPLPINHVANVMWFVMRSRSPVPWLEGTGIEDVAHALYVLHWDRGRGLLFINHSANEGVNTGLAKAVAGNDVQLIKGEQVFRAMGGMTRPIPTNVGVLDIYSRARRFSMYAGSNVTDGLPASEEATKVQTNMFAVGFRDGERASVGVSLKGRIWSYLVADTILDWIGWCRELGERLLDERIDVREVKRNFIRPEVLSAWPEAVPLGAEWPMDLLISPPESLRVTIGDTMASLADIDLVVEPHRTEDGHVRLTLRVDDSTAQYDIVLDSEGMRPRAVSAEATFETQRRTSPGTEFLTRYCPIILLGGDGVVSPPGVLYRPNRQIPPLDRAELTPISWRGVKLNRESRGQSKDPATVQGRTLAWLLEKDWQFVLDDDGTGEVADLVALRVEERSLEVLLAHCKFAHGGTVNARLDDLYELCGQAQKSAAWRRHPESMIRRLLARERSRVSRGRLSGFEVGTPEDLLRLLHEQLPSLDVDLEIALAQPGLSRSRASTQQLELLAAVKTYVRETSAARLTILTSE